MSKNIEIQINTGSTYEVLYPKIDLTNNQGTSLPLSNTSGNLAASRLSAGTLSGSFTFSSVPYCSSSPTSSYYLANKAYVDNKVSGASGSEIQIVEYKGNGNATSLTISFSSSSKTINGVIIFPNDNVKEEKVAVLPVFSLTRGNYTRMWIPYWGGTTSTANQWNSSKISSISWGPTSITISSDSDSGSGKVINTLNVYYTAFCIFT